MVREFGVLRKIELAEKQNEDINKMVEIALSADKNKDMLAVVISTNCLSANKLNENFCPVIWTKNDNYDFYLTLKTFSPIMPEIQTLPEMLPKDYIVLWKAE